MSAQNQQVMKAKQTSNKDQTAKNPGANRGSSSRGRDSGDVSIKDYDVEDGNATVVEGEKGVAHKGAPKTKGKHGKRKGTS